MSLAWKVTCETHTQKLVLIALADNANDQHVCWPSTIHLAKKCNLSQQGVIDQIEKLSTAGHVKVERARGRANRYIVLANHPTLLGAQELTPPNAVGHHHPTLLGAPPNAVGHNHKQPSLEPSNKKAKEFILKWQGAWFETYGIRCAVQKSEEAIVSALIASGFVEDELLKLARAAWKNKDFKEAFWCRRAVSITGFAKNLNEIQDEISRLNNPAALSKLAPNRNASTFNKPDEYRGFKQKA